MFGTNDTDCGAQDVIFSTVCSVGMIAFYVAILIGGFLLDIYGLWLIRVLLVLSIDLSLSNRIMIEK